jgi:hypothetical protein
MRKERPRMTAPEPTTFFAPHQLSASMQASTMTECALACATRSAVLRGGAVRCTKIHPYITV